MTEIFKIQDLKTIHDYIVVQEMNFDMRTLSSGIVLLKDDRSTAGIRPRWARVCLTGPEQSEIRVGQWILVEHGRWTRGVEIDGDEGKITIRRVDPDCVLAISDDEPVDDSISTAVQAGNKSLY
jgi:hypothetical protein